VPCWAAAHRRQAQRFDGGSLNGAVMPDDTIQLAADLASSLTTGRMSDRIEIVGRVSGRHRLTVGQKLAILRDAFGSDGSVRGGRSSVTGTIAVRSTFVPPSNAGCTERSAGPAPDCVCRTPNQRAVTDTVGAARRGANARPDHGQIGFALSLRARETRCLACRARLFRRGCRCVALR
jgi:hypothetical protein